jgi:hypothetical protein
MNTNRYRYLLESLFLLLLLLSNGFGQEKNSTTMGTRFIADVGDAFNGSVYVFSRPLYWQGDDWLNFGYVIAGAAVLSLVDTGVREFFVIIKYTCPGTINYSNIHPTSCESPYWL